MRIKMKRFLGILLSLALMLGMMPGMSLTAYADTQSFLILRDSAFFNATGYANNGVWQGSNAQLWCTNYYTSNLKTNFAEYIDGVDKTDEEKTITQGSSTYSCASQEIKGSTGGENIDKVFFLSAAEYEQYKNTNDMILTTGYGLRTVGNKDTNDGALYINSNGTYAWAMVQYANLSARPALYLKSTFFKAYKDDSGIRYWSSNASEPGYTESTNLTSEFTNHTNKLKLNDDTYWTVLGYKIPTYTVTFDSNGHGTAPASQKVPSGEKVTKPSDPTDQVYTFAGWYKEEACTNAWNFETDTVTAGTTLYAKWIEITKYPIYVGGVQVTSANASNIDGNNKASYDADINTLTLKGVSIDTAHSSAGIYYNNNDTPNKPLNVILKGANSIGGSGISTGIYGDGYYGSFTFSGEGSLNTTGTSIGIGTYKGSVEIDSGTINACGTDSSGIYANGGIVINGGNVEATGANFGIQSMYGVRISDGTVTTEATNSTENTGAAIYDGSSSNGISITGGTVTANGTSSNGKAHGLYLGSSGAITIGADITSLTVTGKTSASVGKVENSIVGMGWNTVDGTGDGTEIAVNTSGASLESYKKLLFPYKKPAAIVKTAPTAKSDLIYNGSAQELITPGDKGEGAKEIQYAIGTDSSTAPKEDWSASIPTATKAGTYYVWYKAIGDSEHEDSKADVIEVTIKEKTEAHNHDIKYVEAKEPTCTEDGYEAHYECTVEGCGEWFEDDTKCVPIDKEKFIKKATGHKWDDGVITQEATYDETGIKTYTCSVCGETKGETIPVKTRRSSSSSDTSDSDSESSGGGSIGKSGSISQKSIDVNGNTVQTQPDSGAPLSDRGGNWGNQEHIWTYTKSDGSLAKGEWLNLEYNGHTYWYYFDDSTIMQTNWFDYNGSRYFLVPEMDGWRGRMATGWHQVDNKWYYFEPTLGAYQGILYRGMTTPDGHTVGADGAWDGNGTTPIGTIHTGTTITMN